MYPFWGIDKPRATCYYKRVGGEGRRERERIAR
jgi:hypothetical protein